ncbi:hypothetical protein GQ457_15G016990 [Hibiscus cannabinus]
MNPSDDSANPTDSSIMNPCGRLPQGTCIIVVLNPLKWPSSLDVWPEGEVSVTIVNSLANEGVSMIHALLATATVGGLSHARPSPPQLARVVRPSFQDILASDVGEVAPLNTLCNLDVELGEDDLHIGTDGLLPKVRFSGIVHTTIGDKISNSVIA